MDRPHQLVSVGGLVADIRQPHLRGGLFRLDHVIPFGIQHFKPVKIALAPIAMEVVPVRKRLTKAFDRALRAARD